MRNLEFGRHTIEKARTLGNKRVVKTLALIAVAGLVACGGGNGSTPEATQPVAYIAGSEPLSAVHRVEGNDHILIVGRPGVQTPFDVVEQLIKQRACEVTSKGSVIVDDKIAQEFLTIAKDADDCLPKIDPDTGGIPGEYNVVLTNKDDQTTTYVIFNNPDRGTKNFVANDCTIKSFADGPANNSLTVQTKKPCLPEAIMPPAVATQVATS